ncbi:MAG: F0F1 ATP synthase subunit B [Elusimicrobiota bacterium]|jgi:F-type H+-transporting ATPase subunit b|nr:F0F1 ATP synthase subunit B [Elusimicrobiota bacterium]
MEALFQPDWGLTFWTAVNFLILALLLAKFAWGPLVAALDARESKIAADIENARKANEDSQKIKEDLKAQLDNIAAQSVQKLKEAAALGELQKQKILDEAKAQAQTLVETARAQIAADTDKAARQLKKEFTDIALLAVKKIIGREAAAEGGGQIAQEMLKDFKDMKAK